MDYIWILVAIASAVTVGLSKGGIPMAGALSVPILATVMDPVAAAGLLLPVYVIADFFGLWAYRKHFDPRVLKIMIPATTLGVGVGWLMADVVPERFVLGLVGMIGLVFALNAIFRPSLGARREARTVPGLVWGTIAGFTSFVSHSGGPPFQAYAVPLNMPSTIFAGTATILFSYVNAIKLIPYIALGEINFDSLSLAVLLAIPASLSVFVGVRLVRVIPQKLFYQLLIWVLLVLSIKLLWDAVIG
ncbi:hypothetical protein BFP70_06980 [Thioclava sp. SK-1]|uniref:sulfite exporter TauE/SafE family protein n=1 Tax=Thioclava sp. SK-1 TaxID=1889770 RepID=UPI00082529B6|nr:sulfite exporter TauE/SafE family protein [Thioclava sp. SK-1]OCX65875.1 hypothetical protein BFP70_06980 [Thioclava sp. SK-1]